MAVNREFRCMAHDHEFESREERPACPYGCSPAMVVLEFRTPVGIKNTGTRVHDNLQRQLASDFNMTDMRGDKDGTSVMSNTRLESGGARHVGDNGKPYWDASRLAPGWVQRGEAAPAYSTQGLLPPLARVGNRDVPSRIPIQAIREGAGNYLKSATRFVQPKKKP